MPFQSTINQNLPPAVEGDFASANPRASLLPNSERLVAGPNGTYVGRFAWLDGDEVNNTGTGAPDAFIHRNHQALNYNLLSDSTMLIPQGYGAADAMVQGEFWVRTTTAATRGQKVFAFLADGTVATGAAGATVTDAIETKYTVVSDAEADELIKISSWV